MDQDKELDEGDVYERPSKSQIKRDMLALQALGKRLVETPNERLKKLDLGEHLRDAILLAQRTNSREGKRRQVHYVGKLMRDVENPQAIAAQLDAWANGSAEETANMHRLERDRDRLMESDQHLTDWLSRHPSVDIQAMRSLIRAARQEAKHNEQLLEGQAPQRKHFRALFQAIKATYELEARQADADTDTDLTE